MGKSNKIRRFCELQMLFEHRHDLFLGAETDKTVDDLAVLEQNNGRNALNAEFACQRDCFVNVCFADLDIGVFFAERIKNGSEHFARTAPGCVKVKKNKTLDCFYFFVKIIFVDLNVCHK